MDKNKVAISKVINRRLKVNSNGYVLIKVGNQFVPEHRLVVEKKIGRLLKPEETIHHIDHDRKNNHIDNLMFFPNQKEHKKFENKVNQFGLTNPIKRQMELRWKEFE